MLSTLIGMLVQTASCLSFDLVIEQNKWQKKWDKDQVRITLSCPFETGFLGYLQSVMDGRELRPELLLRVEFIEGHVEFLKVGVSSCVLLTCSNFYCVVRCVI